MNDGNLSQRLPLTSKDEPTNVIELFKLTLVLEVKDNDKPYFMRASTGPVDNCQM